MPQKNADRRKNNKKRSLDEVLQQLEQARITGNKFQVKIWTDILKKLQSSNDKSKGSNRA